MEEPPPLPGRQANGKEQGQPTPVPRARPLEVEEVFDDQDDVARDQSFTLLEEPKPQPTLTTIASTLRGALYRAAASCDSDSEHNDADDRGNCQTETLPTYAPPPPIETRQRIEREPVVGVTANPSANAEEEEDVELGFDDGSVLFLREGFESLMLSSRDDDDVFGDQDFSSACGEATTSFCFDPANAFVQEKELLAAALQDTNKKKKQRRRRRGKVDALLQITYGLQEDEDGMDLAAQDAQWKWWQCCTESNWMQRVRTNWDSPVISITLVMVVVVLMIMVSLASALNKYATHFEIHTRCFVLHGALPARVSTVAVALVVVSLAEYVVLFVVALWMALLCSMNTQRLRRHLSENNHMLPNNNLVTAFLLPCYEGFWYAVAWLAALGIIVLGCSFYVVNKPNPSRLFFYHRDFPCDLQSLPFVWILLLLPMLMIQRSVSKSAMKRTIRYAGAVCGLFVVALGVFYQLGEIATGIMLLAVRVVMLAIYIWAKHWCHARASFDYFFWMAIISGIIRIISTICTMVMNNNGLVNVITRSIGMVYDSFMILPMLMTLRADTKYWLGIDDDPIQLTNPIREYMLLLAERGMITSFSTQTSVYDVHNMIEEHKKNVVDFSCIELYDIIAQGATSIVMRGQLIPLKRAIALKIYTAIRVTEEELERFSRETALLVQLSHPNVVQFYGICVVPPSISLVFEHCEYGSLDVVLDQSVASDKRWDLSTKLKAWLDACRAVAYLHSFDPPLLHRDIKPDNYLVAKNFILKLTDFGEANLLRPRSDGTMTIAGTVDFMAPEMILGGKTARYGTGVDVYSLMITLWKIMMPAACPWANRTHLQVYQAVTSGERPFLDPRVIPAKCQQVLKSGWAPNPSDRTRVADMVPIVEQLWMMSLHAKRLPRTKFR